MGEPADNVVNDFIIDQSFNDNPENTRNKEFCIDNAEYTEVKPRNLKRKVLIIALSMVGIVGAGVVAAIQSGYLGMRAAPDHAPFQTTQPNQLPAPIASLPPSLQKTEAPQNVAEPVPAHGTQASLQQNTLPDSLSEKQQHAVPETNQASLHPQSGLNAPDKPSPTAIPQPSPAAPSQSLTPAPEKVAVKPMPEKKVESKVASTPSQSNVPQSSKPASAVASKQLPASSQAKHTLAPVNTSPILANGAEHGEGSVKPLNMVSADRIGLRGMSKNSLQLQRGANILTYGVGDSLPNGETIKYIDDKTMTVVTDKQVMRITN